MVKNSITLHKIYLSEKNESLILFASHFPLLRILNFQYLEEYSADEPVRPEQRKPEKYKWQITFNLYLYGAKNLNSQININFLLFIILYFYSNDVDYF